MGKGDKSHLRKKTGKRTPSGALSRSAEERSRRRKEAQERAYENDVRQVVYAARNRHRQAFKQPQADTAGEWRRKALGVLTKQQVKDGGIEHRGSYLGCLMADGKITPEHLAAGENYCARYIAYAALNGLPYPTPQGASYGAVRGGSRPERLRAARAAKVEHMADQAVLKQCSAGVVWAIKRACVLDEAAPVHLITEGLSALVGAGR